MSINYILILMNIVLMFVVVIMLFFREKSKSKKLQKQFNELKDSIEKTKEETDIEAKIRALKDKADSIIDDTDESIKNTFNSLSNRKIIEFEEYANQLFEKIELNHKEVVFLYDMLNDKSESIKVQFAKMEEAKNEMYNLLNKVEKQITKDSSVDDKIVVEKEEFKEVMELCKEITPIQEDEVDNHDESIVHNEELQDSEEKLNSDYELQNEKIIKLYSLGYSTLEISKKLGIGTGEVALVNNLYKNRVIV